MKHLRAVRVYAGNSMNSFLNTLLMLGGLVAAGAVALMCVVCFVVWVAGGRAETRK